MGVVLWVGAMRRWDGGRRAVQHEDAKTGKTDACQVGLRRCVCERAVCAREAPAQARSVPCGGVRALPKPGTIVCERLSVLGICNLGPLAVSAVSVPVCQS